MKLKKNEGTEKCQSCKEIGGYKMIEKLNIYKTLRKTADLKKAGDILDEVVDLFEDKINEIIDHMQKHNIQDDALSKIWNTPEEDEAWKHLDDKLDETREKELREKINTLENDEDQDDLDRVDLNRYYKELTELYEQAIKQLQEDYDLLKEVSDQQGIAIQKQSDVIKKLQQLKQKINKDTLNNSIEDFYNTAYNCICYVRHVNYNDRENEAKKRLQEAFNELLNIIS